jgi:preprotein translocase subunit SecD
MLACDDQGQKFLLGPAIIEGTQINSANASIPQNQINWSVQLSFDSSARSTFGRVTTMLDDQQGSGPYRGGQFAIVLDSQVISYAGVNEPILNGSAEITGNFDQQSAQSLANSLKYGALPLTFRTESVEEEGPELASDQLKAGIVAGIIGLLLVVAYCLMYYRGLGLVVISSLIVAGAITYALVLLLGSWIGFTLTLPGIAGLIVAIGITADSFIVYFERLRDEVRGGRTLRTAVEAGWVRARLTILAADTVSFLAALVLYIFAIGVVKGFAFALGLTTLVDVVIVFLFTKPVVTLLARTKFFGDGHRFSGLDSRHLGVDRLPAVRGPRRPARGSV